MILKKTVSTYNKLRQLPNLAANELIGLLNYLSSEREANKVNLDTVFSHKSKEQIIEMIVLGSDINDGTWGEKGRHLISLLTDLLSFHQEQDEVILSPSLYLQYLELNKLQELSNYKAYNKEHDELLHALREFLYVMTRDSKSEEHTNEQFGFIVMQLIRNLTHLESIKVPKSMANRVAIQKAWHMRIANADYSYTHISQDRLLDLVHNGIALVYKHIKQSSFLGAVGSIDAQYTIFEDCDFKNAKFYHSSFEWTTFINTSIEKATFNDCRIFDVDFAGMTNTDSAVFINCRLCLCKILDCKALFIDCDFDECELADDLRIINNEDNKAEKQDIAPKVAPDYETSKIYIADMRALFVKGSAPILIETISGMLEDDSDDDMVSGRAIAFISAITRPLIYLRDRDHITLDLATYIEYMELSKVEELLFKHDGKYGDKFDEVLHPLLAYIETVPGYDISRIDKGQDERTNEQFGFIAMQVLKVLNHLESLKA